MTKGHKKKNEDEPEIPAPIKKINFEDLRVPKDRTIKVTPVFATITMIKPNKTDFFRIRTRNGVCKKKQQETMNND